MNKDTTKLWNRDFVLVFISNFLVFLCYYMLVPVLPRYIMESLGLRESMVGIIVGSFTIASLSIRPISGFIVDKFSRKPLYLLCYGLFAAAMGGYVFTSSVVLFIILRIIHGYGFGLNTVGGLTYAIDVLPSDRRGAGISYFGVAYSVAMAIGPLLGNLLYKNGVPFDMIFAIIFAIGAVGLLTVLPIKAVKKIVPENATNQKVTLGRFILLRAMPCVAIIAMTGYGYGAISNFIALYPKEVSFDANVGYFFLILASCIAIARIFSAKMINQGKVLKSTYIGGALVLAAYTLFLICDSALIFYTLAALFGLGFGYFGSSFQAMLVNLAQPTQRGTASATYYTFWDMGIGLGTVTGGVVLEKLDFQSLLILCTALTVLAIIYFRLVSDRYYTTHKL
ncbi:MAG: MFS transporter [Rikenellaceae bacterium]